MTDKLEALKAKKPLDTKTLAAEKAGYVTDDNSGGYYVVECQECGEVYPSQESGGGGQIADTGDYDDSYCPHCGYVDPDECDNVGLVWNVQQAKINALLAALEELKAKTSTCMGVGNGSGNLFVYGDYDSIKAAQRIVLESEKLRAALEEKDQELDKEGDILIDTQESMREWKLRANAAEQREEHLKATVDVLSAKNAELERANSAQNDHINQQQDRVDTLEKKNDELGKHIGKLEKPIKLPDIRSEDYHESGWFQHMKYYRDVVRSIQVLELKVEGE